MSFAPKRESLALLLGDILVFVFSLWGALFLRRLTIPDLDYVLLHLEVFVYVFAAWAFVFFFAGLYSKDLRFVSRKQPERILLAQSANAIIAAAFFLLLPEGGIAPKTVLAIYIMLSTALLLLWRVILFPAIRSRHRFGAVMIASGDDAEALVEAVNNGKYALRFGRMLDTATLQPHHIIEQLIRRLNDADVTVIVADQNADVLTQGLPLIYDAAFRKQRFAFVPLSSLYQEVFDRVPLSSVSYDWVLRNLNAQPAYDVLKRTLDMVGAALLGAAAIILLPFIVLAIKLDDGGRIFASVECVGRFYGPIHLWFFRTTKQGMPAKQKTQYSRVGAVLARYHFDEIPLLWNVLKGDLSFVGPQAVAPPRALKYASQIPYYNARHLIAPGLTGWARVMRTDAPNEYRGVENMKRILAYDLYYLKNRSLMLDFYVILRTLRIIFMGRMQAITEE